MNCTPTNGDENTVKAPEYYFYAQFVLKSSSSQLAVPALDAWQVGNLTDAKYSYFGIGNTYNAKTLYWYFATNQWQNDNEYITSTKQMWGLSSQEKVYQVL